MIRTKPARNPGGEAAQTVEEYPRGMVTNAPRRGDASEEMNAAANDAELLSQYRFRKSEAAFQRLVERYQSMVLGTAFRRTGNFETASDVTQRVFAVLARKAGLLIGRTSIAGWLHQAAQYESMRAAQAEARMRARQVPFVNELLYTLPEQRTLPTPERWIALEEAIDSLGAPDREVLVLHYFQDLSYEEMARTLGMHAPAVRKRVSRALEHLAATLRARGVAGNAPLLLAAAVAIQTSLAPPAGLSHAALATAAAGGGASAVLTLTALLTHTTVKTIAIVVALASLPLLWFSMNGDTTEPPFTAGLRAPAGMTRHTDAGESNPPATFLLPPPVATPPLESTTAGLAGASSAVHTPPAPARPSIAPAAVRIPRPAPPVTTAQARMRPRGAAPGRAIPRARASGRVASIAPTGRNFIDDVSTSSDIPGNPGLDPTVAAAALGNLLDELLVLNPAERAALSEFLSQRFLRLSGLRARVSQPRDVVQTVLQAQQNSAVADLVEGIRELVPATAATPEVISAVVAITEPVVSQVLAAPAVHTDSGQAGAGAALPEVSPALVPAIPRPALPAISRPR